MNKHEFNAHCAWLDGRKLKRGENFDYHDDLNLLMPLAWKHRLTIQPYAVSNDGVLMYSANTVTDGFKRPYVADKDPIQAIREALWEISK